MAVFTTGYARLIRRTKTGQEIALTPPIALTQADNDLAPRTILLNTGINTPGASDDTPVNVIAGAQAWIHGGNRELLVLQIKDDVAHAFVTATSSLELGVHRKYRDAATKQVVDHPDVFTFADRLQETDDAVQGLKDDTGTIASKWSDVGVFRPDQAENLTVDGYIKFVAAQV